MNPDYPSNILKIPNHIENSPAQYMYRKGIKQYSLCGEFCVAYCMKDEAHTDTIDDFLDYWQSKDLTLYQSLFKNGLGRTTGINDLERMLADYGVLTPCQRFAPVSPVLDFISSKLEDYQAIIGVQIDYNGFCVGKGIPHWIVLERLVVADDRHAIAPCYNPFTNNLEPYSWREIMTSTGAYKQGIWIPRT
jgi:hypothetical protein